MSDRPTPLPTDLGRHFKPSPEDLRRIASTPSCAIQVRGEFRAGMEVWARAVDGSATEFRRCEVVTLPGWLVTLIPTVGESSATSVDVELRERGVVLDRISIPLDRSVGGKGVWMRERVETLLDLRSEGAIGTYLASAPERSSCADWSTNGIKATEGVARLLRAQLAAAGLRPADRETLSAEIDRRAAALVAEFRFKSQ